MHAGQRELQMNLNYPLLNESYCKIFIVYIYSYVLYYL